MAERSRVGGRVVAILLRRFRVGPEEDARGGVAAADRRRAHPPPLSPHPPRALPPPYRVKRPLRPAGAETLIPRPAHGLAAGADAGVREIVLGMAHRGRLNVLANVLCKPYQEIFSEFEENYLPNSSAGDGDVKY